MMQKDRLAPIALSMVLTIALCLPALGRSEKSDLGRALAEMAGQIQNGIKGTGITRIGVSEFNPTAGSPIKLGPYWSDRLTAELVQGGVIEVIERAKLEVILQEQGFGLTDAAAASSTQEVGRLLGIQAFVVGTYTVLGKSVDISARLVDVGTGKILASSSVKLKKGKDTAALFAPLVPETPLQLEASLLAQRQTERGWEAVMVPEAGALYSNDNIKLFFRTNEDCYVYVLLFGSSGEAQQLFPHPQVNLSNRAEAKRDYYVPPGENWFWLDEKTGTETIFVIASYQPLRDVDKLLVEMERAGEKEKLSASEKMERSLAEQTRGIGGVRPGGKVTFTTSDGKKIEKVTEAITGQVKVVRKLSFQHR